MHELSLAMSALEIVKESAKQNDLQSVEKIIMEKGELSGVLDDSFIYAFKILSKDTIAENAVVEIIYAQALAFCKSCNKDFVFTHFEKTCPICKSPKNIEFNPSQFYVKSIEGNMYEN